MKFICVFFFTSFSFAYPQHFVEVLNSTLIHYSFLNPSLTMQIKNDPSTFASADSNGITAQLTVSSGLLNSGRLSADGLRIILCHELGHIYGGSPRRHVPFEWDGPTANDGLSFLSSEGQSDYYATISCFSKLTNGQDHEAVLKNSLVSEKIKQSCVHLKDDEQLICQRALLGSLNFLNLNISLNISIETADSHITPVLIQDQYPSAQCRLDTLVAGARCPVKKTLVLDFVHSTSNDCDIPLYARPPCWHQSNSKN